jgi:hypothetical protein
MERPPTKWKWKAMLNKAVEEYHMTEWYNEVEDKTSLKYLTLQKHPTGNSHPIWHTVPVKVFFSICVVIGMAPSSEYTAMVGQRSVSPWICLSSRLSKESSSCSSPLVRVTTSNP